MLCLVMRSLTRKPYENLHILVSYLHSFVYVFLSLHHEFPVNFKHFFYILLLNIAYTDTITYRAGDYFKRTTHSHVSSPPPPCSRSVFTGGGGWEDVAKAVIRTHSEARWSIFSMCTTSVWAAASRKESFPLPRRIAMTGRGKKRMKKQIIIPLEWKPGRRGTKT